jgi:hypothetical protein
MNASKLLTAERHHAVIQEDKRLNQVPDVRRAHQAVDGPPAVTSLEVHNATRDGVDAWKIESRRGGERGFHAGSPSMPIKIGLRDVSLKPI